MVPHLESVTYHTLAWATLHRHVGHTQLQTVRSDLMKLYHDPILYRYILSICVTHVVKGVPEKVWEHFTWLPAGYECWRTGPGDVSRCPGVPPSGCHRPRQGK